MTVEANGFDWDRGNFTKCEKHGLSVAAIESLFSYPLAIFPDVTHSQQESRFRAVGQTEKGRRIFIVFTLRRRGDETLIRPITARYMNKKEIKAFEKENPQL
jgi:uncharacterized protein